MVTQTEMTQQTFSNCIQRRTRQPVRNLNDSRPAIIIRNQVYPLLDHLPTFGISITPGDISFERTFSAQEEKIGI